MTERYPGMSFGSDARIANDATYERGVSTNHTRSSVFGLDQSENHGNRFQPEWASNPLSRQNQLRDHAFVLLCRSYFINQRIISHQQKKINFTKLTKWGNCGHEMSFSTHTDWLIDDCCGHKTG